MTTRAPPPPPPPPPPRPAAAGGTSDRSRSTADDPADKRAAAILASPTGFTVASYLNTALGSGIFAHDPGATATGDDGSGKDGTNADDDDDDSRMQAKMAELALLLQVQTQSCHDEIGRIGAELQAILPRCRGDVERLEQGLGGMAEDASGLLQSVRGGSASASSDGRVVPTTSPAVDTLSTLHALRSNLRRTRHILSAASSWDATLSSIPGLLSTQNLSEAVAALSSLERGERALSGGMPGGTERREELARIRSQIEVLLRPQLLHALSKMDTRLGPLQQCVSMYVQLDKMDALVEEYVRLRPLEVHRGWFAFVAPTPAQPVEQTLSGAAAADMTEGEGDDNVVEQDEQANLGLGIGEGESSTDVTATASKAFASAFLAWLPGWYGSVLALLSEEMRKASAVFGPKLAPGIVIKVLRECFRPILPSFRTRLSSLCPSNIQGARHPSSITWSLDSVCSAYEATLHFLSKSYEQLVASMESSLAAAPMSGGKDGIPTSSGAAAAESSTFAAESPAAAYRLITSAFVFVASPFSPYQLNFAKVERKHCGSTSEIVARNIQAAVGGRSVSSDLSSLQGAVDALQRLGSSVFSQAEASVSRFDLLNCGYNTNAAVATVDDVIAQHAGELAIAVSTLRTSMTADEDQLAGNFDEELVQCSLEILKVAGGMKRNLTLCEGKTTVVFREMSERLELYRERYAFIQGTSNSGSSDPSSAVPDSLSSVDVAFIVARAAFGEEQEGQDQEILATLASFLPGENGGPGHTVALFPKATEAVTRLAHTCHVFVFDVCSAVPRRALRELPSLQTWRKVASTQDALAYGILPQQYITAVGEHMLALVQAIEPFASDAETLELADIVMEDAKNVALPSWRDFASAIGSTDACSEETVIGLMNVRSLKAYVTNADDDPGREEEEDEGADVSATALFTNKWLDAIGLAVTGYLLERTLRVPHLSQRGCEHILADYSYLINVFEALGIAGHPHPILLHFAKLFSMPVNEMIASADERKAMGRAIRGSEMRIGLMRGVESA